MPFCCVPLCAERQDRRRKDENGPKVSFHKLPTDPEMLRQFTARIRRDVGPNFQVNRHTRICSKHYRNEDFYCYNPPSGKRELKPGVLPSVFNFHVDLKDEVDAKEQNAGRSQTRERRTLNSSVVASPAVHSGQDAKEVDPLQLDDSTEAEANSESSPLDADLFSAPQDILREETAEALREMLEDLHREKYLLLYQLGVEKRARRVFETEISELTGELQDLQRKLSSAHSEVSWLREPCPSPWVHKEHSVPSMFILPHY